MLRYKPYLGDDVDLNDLITEYVSAFKPPYWPDTGRRSRNIEFTASVVMLWTTRYDVLPDEVAEEREVDTEVRLSTFRTQRTVSICSMRQSVMRHLRAMSKQVDAKVLMLITSPDFFGASQLVLQVCGIVPRCPAPFCISATLHCD